MIIYVNTKIMLLKHIHYKKPLLTDIASINEHLQRLAQNYGVISHEQSFLNAEKA